MLCNGVLSLFSKAPKANFYNLKKFFVFPRKCIDNA